MKNKFKVIMTCIPIVKLYVHRESFICNANLKLKLH